MHTWYIANIYQVKTLYLLVLSSIYMVSSSGTNLVRLEYQTYVPCKYWLNCLLLPNKVIDFDSVNLAADMRCFIWPNPTYFQSMPSDTCLFRVRCTGEVATSQLAAGGHRHRICRVAAQIWQCTHRRCVVAVEHAAGLHCRGLVHLGPFDRWPHDLEGLCRNQRHRDVLWTAGSWGMQMKKSVSGSEHISRKGFDLMSK